MAIPLPQIFGDTRAIITSGFGPRKNPTSGASKYHRGVDIAAQKGTPVRSLAGGKVIDSGYNKKDGFYIKVDHGSGYQSSYGHLDTKALFDVGQEIQNGQVIGQVGSTGVSTGPHTHVGIKKDGKHINPKSIQDLELLIRPNKTENNPTVQTVSKPFISETTPPTKEVNTTENINTMSKPNQTAGGTYQKEGRGKVYATSGDMATDILGKNIGQVSANELMTMAMNQGYSRKDAKRAVKGLEKFQQLGGQAEMVFDPNANKYNVIFKNEDGGVEVNPRQGRRLGSNAAFGAADLLGLGRNVNTLASVISRQRGINAEKKAAADKTADKTGDKTAEEPTLDITPKTETPEVETEIPEEDNVLQEESVVSIPPLLKRPNIHYGIDLDTGLPVNQPKSEVKSEAEDAADIKRRYNIGIGEDFTARFLGSMANVVKAPSEIAEWMANTVGLPNEGFGGGDSYLTQLRKWVEGRKDKYKNYENPKYNDLFLYNALANAPEIATVNRMIPGFGGPKVLNKVPNKAVSPKKITTPNLPLANQLPKIEKLTPRSPLPPRSPIPPRSLYGPNSTLGPSSPLPPRSPLPPPKYPTGTIGGEMGVVRSAGKYADDIAKALKSNPNAKSLVLKDGTRVRLKKGGWEAYEKGGKLSAASLMGLPKASLGMNFSGAFEGANKIKALMENKDSQYSLLGMPSGSMSEEQPITKGDKSGRFSEWFKGLFEKNADVDPNKRKFGLSDFQSVAKYAMPLTELAAANRFKRNMKMMQYQPVSLRQGAIRNLPNTVSPLLSRIENKGSDLLTNQAMSLYRDSFNRAQETDWRNKNQMFLAQQRDRANDIANQEALTNARLKQMTDAQNVQMQNMGEKGISDAIRNIGLATQGNLANDAAQRNYLQGIRESGRLELMARNPNLFSEDEKKKMFAGLGLPMKKGGKLKIKIAR